MNTKPNKNILMAELISIDEEEAFEKAVNKFFIAAQDKGYEIRDVKFSTVVRKEYVLHIEDEERKEKALAESDRLWFSALITVQATRADLPFFGLQESDLESDD